MATDSSSSSAAEKAFIGSFISLISKYEVRYEGVVYHLDAQSSTIGLKNVRSYGSEGRKKDGPQVPPSDKVYEYILFRGSDIKDLQVKAVSSSFKEEQILSDPAIIQSQHSEAPSSSPVASVGGRGLTESNLWQDTPAVISRDIPLPAGLSSHQSTMLTSPSGQSAVTHVSSAPFSSTMHWPEYSGISGNSPHSLLQSTLQSPLGVVPFNTQSWGHTPEIQSPYSKVDWTTLPEHGEAVSSATAPSLVNPSHKPSPFPIHTFDNLDASSLLSSKTPLPHHSSFAESNMPSFSSPFQGINSVKDQFPGQLSPHVGLMFPGQSAHHSVSPLVDSTSGSSPRPPSFSTSDQFDRSRQNFVTLAQNQIADQNHMGSLAPTSSSSSFLLPSPGFQESLSPSPILPTSVDKPQYSASQYHEEFDFEAMNEKFKKDEVWGSLGRASNTTEGLEYNAPTDSLGDRECSGLQSNLNPEPAYKKDDFFDTISCNSLGHGPSNRLSERMKMDTETFGNFNRSPTMGYGAYGGGRSEYYRNSYNRGRGYGYYGRRGRGRNMPFY